MFGWEMGPSDAAAPPARAPVDSRETLGELWSQVAVVDVFGCDQQALVGSRAKRLLEMAEQDLLGAWKGSSVSRRAVVRTAVIPLECSARVWRAFGPAAGERRPHLLDRSQEALATSQREVRAAERSLLVNRPTVSRAGHAACAAIDDLLRARADRAEALSALEDAAVELAALAIRIAANLDRIGSAPRRYAKQPAPLAGQLNALACEVSKAARKRQNSTYAGAEGDHIGVWLEEVLRVAPPADAIELWTLRGGDPCLRAGALCSLRARWLELAAGLWLIAHALDDLLVLGTFDDEQRLKGAVSSRARGALITSALCERPGEFDHAYAWDRHRAVLFDLVRVVCLALQTREEDAIVRSQQLALRRLARAVAAIWAIDECTRQRVREASEPSC